MISRGVFPFWSIVCTYSFCRSFSFSFSFSFSTPSPSSIHPCLLLGYRLCLECMHMGSTGPVQLMYTAHWMYSQLTRIILDGYIYRQLPRQDQGMTKAMDIFL